MGSLNVIPRLAEKNGVFRCSDLTHKDASKRYEVPVEHRRFELFGDAFDQAMERVLAEGGGKTAQQIAEVMSDSGGIGLFAAKGWPWRGPDCDREPTQEEHGALVIIPPQFWEEEREDLRQWLPADDEDDPFAKLPYGLEDMAIFAKVNFTPDVWYYVTHGPLEGKIFRWQHDDVSELTRPWAEDFIAWADRVWSEVPDLFGGITRWNRSATPDEDCPNDAELYPLEFQLA